MSSLSHHHHHIINFSIVAIFAVSMASLLESLSLLAVALLSLLAAMLLSFSAFMLLSLLAVMSKVVIIHGVIVIVVSTVVVVAVHCGCGCGGCGGGGGDVIVVVVVVVVDDDIICCCCWCCHHHHFHHLLHSYDVTGWWGNYKNYLDTDELVDCRMHDFKFFSSISHFSQPILYFWKSLEGATMNFLVVV